MSDLPWIKFYIGDHVRDTHHLSLAEQGAYLMLMFKAWHVPGCSIPDDPKWIQRQLHVGPEEYEQTVRPILDEFFMRENGRLFQSRLRKEYADALTSRARQSRAGKKAAATRWKPQVVETAEFD